MIFLMVSVSVLYSFKSFVVMCKVSLIWVLMYKSFMSNVRNLYLGFICGLRISSVRFADLMTLNSYLNIMSSLSLCLANL
jgi:hypothetical protein